MNQIKEAVQKGAVLNWDETLLGSPADSLFRFLFGDGTASLSNTHLCSSDDKQVYFTGTLDRLLGQENVSVSCCLFDWTEQGGDEPVRHVVLQVELPVSYTLIQYMQTLSQSPETISNLLGGLGINPFMKSFNFKPGNDANHNKLIFSSFDFTDNPGNDQYYPPDFNPVVEAANVKTGLNFQASAQFSSTASEVLDLLSISSSRDFIISIEYSYGAAVVTLTELVDLDATIACFGLKIERLGMSFSIADLGSQWPTLSLEGKIEIGIYLAYSLRFDVENKHLSLAISDFPTFKQAAEKLGLNHIENYFPGPLDVLGELTIEELALEFDLLDTPSLYKVEIIITTQHPAAIIPNCISVNPQLQLQVYPPLETYRSVNAQLSGTWKLGQTTFYTFLYYPGYELEAEMAVGQSLDLCALAQKIVPGVKMPEIDIVDMDLSADFQEKSFEAELDILTDWEIEITSGKNFSVREIDIEVAYANKRVTDCRITGLMELVNIEFEIYGAYDFNGGWTIGGFTSPGQPIPIGTLLKGIAAQLGLKDGNFPDQLGLADEKFPAPLETLEFKNLAASFNSHSKDFTFSGQADFSINNTDFDIKTDILITHFQNGSFDKRFGGQLTIGTTNPLQFDLIFDEDLEKSLMLAGYHSSDGQTIKLSELLQSLMGDDLPIPDVLTFTLNDALLVYDKKSKADTSKQLFVAHIGSGINLSNLPLIGKLFPPNQTIRLTYQVLAASGEFSKDNITTINALMPEGIGTLADDKDITKPLDIATSIQLGLETIHLNLPLDIGEDPPSQPTTTAATSGATPAPAPVKATAEGAEPKWFNLQKTFGPVHFHRIGLKYENSQLKFLLDASLSAGGLTISLDGLSVSSPLTRFDPKFDLKGLGIDYTNEALEIGGAFLRQHIVDGNREYDEYDGMAILKIKELSLAAIGSYAYIDGHPSLFVYASVNEPMGGPSFFFVEGLALGFGYNRALRIPSIDEVQQFPLVAEAIEGAGMPENAGRDTLSAELEKLRAYIPPTPGEMFLAVGVKFNSFKMIDSFALLILSFGHRFQVDLLGMSTLTVPVHTPPEKTPLAEIQMALKATYVPSEGFLGVNAQLTPDSYILSRACRLTGGFAFYSWFSGEHEGDFVTTLGGYHPDFNVPAHYPTVPRLGFNWKVDNHLNLKGDAYFALCPHTLMAGGHLEATYEAGPFKAWFKEGADFLVAWKPYHYDAEIYVDMGASLTYHFFGTHHITIHLGADLHIWGPEFGGEGKVHIWVISVHITFGDQSAQKPGAIDWAGFKESFLPADKDICAVTVSKGLVTKGSGSDDLGVVNPKELTLRIDSVIPSNIAHIVYKENDDIKEDEILKKDSQLYFEDDKYTKPIPFTKNQDDGITQKTSSYSKPVALPGIGSMEISANDLESTQTITITRDGTSVEADFSYTPILKKVPVGLWGTQLEPSLNSAGFIDNALTGFEITPANPPKADRTKPVNRDYFKYETYPLANAFGWEGRVTFKPLEFSDDAAKTKIKDTIMKNSGVRETLLKSMGVDWPIDLNDTAADDFLYGPQIQEVAA
jgi:hypothetical protein